jgi:hypothetical protein|tara:strand:- start:646 stop:858 length:213 start_codon:yes stop_codon:yes gene_type:complete
MNLETRKQIINILRAHNRMDLIKDLNDFLDEDYQEDGWISVDEYSDSEGSAEEEEPYSVETDKQGRQRLI